MEVHYIFADREALSCNYIRCCQPQNQNLSTAFYTAQNKGLKDNELDHDSNRTLSDDKMVVDLAQRIFLGKVSREAQ